MVFLLRNNYEEESSRRIASFLIEKKLFKVTMIHPLAGLN
jgi:hypothetical protein